MKWCLRYCKICTLRIRPCDNITAAYQLHIVVHDPLSSRYRGLNVLLFVSVPATPYHPSICATTQSSNQGWTCRN